MNIAVVVARILLGLVFFAAGLSGFFFVADPPPAPPGLAGEFQDAFFRSGWVVFVDGIELLAGVLLLVNRFVALALTLLGGVISNIIVYHITLAPAGLPIAGIVALLWGIVGVALPFQFCTSLRTAARGEWPCRFKLTWIPSSKRPGSRLKTSAPSPTRKASCART